MPSSISSDFTPLTHGRPRAIATRIPTWKSPESAASLPNRSRSYVTPAAASARIASTIAAAVETGSQSWPSVWSRIARSIPIAIAARS